MREYLNKDYELVFGLTQEDGYIRVPEGATSFCLPSHSHNYRYFYKETQYGLSFCHIGNNSWSTSKVKSIDEMRLVLWERPKAKAKAKVTNKTSIINHKWLKQHLNGELIEYRRTDLTTPRSKVWKLVENYLSIDMFDAKNVEFRVQPKMTIVNRYSINSPIIDKPDCGTTYFVADPVDDELFLSSIWDDDAYDNLLFDRGLCHLSRENAIAHAKAMINHK